MTDKLPKLSKRDIERFAVGIAARTTSHGTKLDPGALAERFWEAGQRCILCRNPSYVWGAYIPGTEADPVTHTGLSESQARLFVYGLCVGCYQAGDAPARAEETIADSMLKEANARAALDAAGTAYTNGALPDGTRLVHLGKEV